MQQHLARNFSCFIRICHLEWLVCKRCGEMTWMPGAFLLLCLAIWPMALPADATQLREIGPGLFWIALLLSLLLSLDKLFNSDFVEHAITHWLLSPLPMSVWVIIRISFISVCFMGLSIAILPMFIIVYDLPILVFWHQCLCLLLSLPSLIALGAIVSALLVGVGVRSVLLPLLITPLWLPILIFATQALILAQQGLPVAAHYIMLLAITCVTLTLSPLVVSASLRMGMEA